MNQPPISFATKRRYDEIAAGLEGAGVNAGTMFGMPTLKLNGKAIGGLWGDAMTFKLDPDSVVEALRLEGVQLFDPSGIGRPMKAWVVVPATLAPEWQRLTQLALSAAEG